MKKCLILLLTMIFSGCIVEKGSKFRPASGSVVYYDNDSYEYTVGCYTDDYEYSYTEADCFPGIISVVICHPNWVRPGCVTPIESRREFSGCRLTHVCEVW